MLGFKFYIIAHVLIKPLENLNDSKFFVVKNTNFDANMEILYNCLYSYKGMKLITIFFFLLHLLVLNDFMMRAKTLERLEEYRVIQKYAHEREQDIQLLHKHREERKMVTLLSHSLIEIKSFKAEISDFVTYPVAVHLSEFFLYIIKLSVCFLWWC